MTSRAKAEARKARAIERNKGLLLDRRAMKETAKIFAGMTQEDLDAMIAKYGTDIAPHEMSKRIATEMLAWEVRKKLKVDNAEHDLGFPADMIEAIDEHMVVELLEGLVEGDRVIDDAATHQWFRNKLDNYRDLCIEFDGQAEEMEALATAIGLGAAMSGDFDVLIDTLPNSGPGDVGILANEAARAEFAEYITPDQWFDPFPEKINFGEGWKQTCFTFEGPEGPPQNPQRHFAEVIANNTSLRVGVLKKYGNVDPISAEAA